MNTRYLQEFIHFHMLRCFQVLRRFGKNQIQDDTDKRG